jgi:molybdopterin synthase catalytic subunit
MSINISEMFEKIKKHPDFEKAGMILCHNGVVRQTSANGRPVSKLKVKVDHAKLQEILERYRKRDGIVEILIEIAENKELYIGDDVMCLIVAGNERKNVISTLSEALDEVKKNVTSKTENFI